MRLNEQALKGWVFLEKRDFEGALDQFSGIDGNDPELTPEILDTVLLGTARCQLALQQNLDLVPINLSNISDQEMLQVKITWARYFELTGDNDSAEAVYRSIKNPRRAVFLNFSYFLQKMGRFDESNAIIEPYLAYHRDKTLELTMARNYQFLGKQYNDSMFYSFAVATYQRILAQPNYCNDKPTLSSLGFCLQEMCLFGEAIATFHLVLKRNPRDAVIINAINECSQQLRLQWQFIQVSQIKPWQCGPSPALISMPAMPVSQAEKQQAHRAVQRERGRDYGKSPYLLWLKPSNHAQAKLTQKIHSEVDVNTKAFFPHSTSVG